jgi:hypothetical protein
MTTTTWHARPELLARFATAPDTIDGTAASSVEQHLMACAACRAVVAAAADPAETAGSWVAVADVIDRPRPSAVERVLAALGVSAGMARLVAATRELRVAWLVTVAGLVVLAVGLARADGSDGPFLVIAPLVPLAAVLLGFVPVADPGGEAGVATPVHGVGLTLRRVVAVVVPALVLVSLGAVAVPGVAGGGVTWLLPGLALAVGALAAATFVRVSVSAGGLGACWVALLGVLSVLDGGVAVGDTFPFAVAGQVTALALLALATAVLTGRRSRFSTLEVGW